MESNGQTRPGTWKKRKHILKKVQSNFAFFDQLLLFGNKPKKLTYASFWDQKLANNIEKGDLGKRLECAWSTQMLDFILICYENKN